MENLFETAFTKLGEDYQRLIESLVATVADKVLEEIKRRELLREDEKGNDLISVTETLKLTKPPIGRTTLYLWVKGGKISVFKVGKRSYFSKNAVLRFLTSVEKKPPKFY